MKQGKNFSIDKPDENINNNEREIRWHMGVQQILDYASSKNLHLKNKLAEINKNLNDQGVANSILSNSIKSFNERLSLQEKNVTEYLEEINDDIINLQQTQFYITLPPK